MIAGSEDTGATQAAVVFSCSMKQAKRRYEMLVYPSADTVTYNLFSMKERITTRRPSGPHGLRVEDFLGSVLLRSVQLFSSKALAEIHLLGLSATDNSHISRSLDCSSSCGKGNHLPSQLAHPIDGW